MDSLFSLFNHLATLLWAVTFLYCLPGFVRFLFGRPRYYDPLKALVVLGATNRTGFQVLSWVFHSPGAVDPDQLNGQVVLYILSCAIAVITVYVVRSYAQSETADGDAISRGDDD